MAQKSWADKWSSDSGKPATPAVATSSTSAAGSIRKAADYYNEGVNVAEVSKSSDNPMTVANLTRVKEKTIKCRHCGEDPGFQSNVGEGETIHVKSVDEHYLTP